MLFMVRDEPSYIHLYKSGQLRKRVDEAYALLSSCTLCPRRCMVNRSEDERGYCNAGYLPKVASYGPHFGEEAPLVGTHGSGTIFLSSCTMRCEFCQNYEISHLAYGKEVSCSELAEMMLNLQARKCHNINFVTPTHFIPQIIHATLIAAEKGLRIPLVYNSGGYDRVESILLLEDVFDIYMPDAKYGLNENAISFSHAPKYVEAMKSSIKEMHRQVGDLIIINGLATRGLIIRHLVLPDNLANSEIVLKFIATEISKESYVNIMDQYRPMGNVLLDKTNPLFKPLLREITREEYLYAIRVAEKYGLHRGFQSIK
jgi:putative pyruvate formate lyase activating enzyme